MLLHRIERRAVWAILAFGAALLLQASLSAPVRHDVPRTPIAISQVER